MKFGLIVEGDTEYYCLPKIVGKLGGVVVGNNNLGGVGPEYPWEVLFAEKVFPFVAAYACRSDNKRPDLVLIVIDRETRIECCPLLAKNAIEVLRKKLFDRSLHIDVSVVIPDITFENWIFVQPSLLDNSAYFDKFSVGLPASLDGFSFSSHISRHIKKGVKWNKPASGGAIVSRVDYHDANVVGRSRSLRKLIKDIRLTIDNSV